MKVANALTDIAKLSGKKVTIEGFLVQRAPEFFLYIAPDEDSIDELSLSIRIVTPLSRDELRNRLLTYMGSRYLYADPAVATGRLKMSDDDIFPALITDLDRLIVHRSDEIIDVSLES